jgi:hypothetical protein
MPGSARRITSDMSHLEGGVRLEDVVHGVGQLDCPVGEVAFQIAELVAHVGEDVVALGLDVLAVSDLYWIVVQLVPQVR